MPVDLVNSMALATVSADHRPSVRMVLLKEYDHNGFIFYTNYDSRKGQDIAQNPAVSLLFWWDELERQVRIEGVTEKIDRVKSEEYFHSRSKSSQLAAIASQQSRPLTTAEELHSRYQQLCAQYAQAEEMPPHPDNWGGYRVKPDRFEFWQGRENRLHDRFQYTLLKDNLWQITRLFP